MNNSVLPHLNASLNALSGILLLFGLFFIGRRKIRAHLACMIAAFVVSVLFLISYLIYHYQTGARTPFMGPDALRPLYYSILISHVILAIVIVPLVLVTLRRAWRGEFGRHKRIARWTFPLWLYVSVTGVVVYLILYQIYPAR